MGLGAILFFSKQNIFKIKSMVYNHHSLLKGANGVIGNPHHVIPNNGIGDMNVRIILSAPNIGQAVVARYLRITKSEEHEFPQHPPLLLLLNNSLSIHTS